MGMTLKFAVGATELVTSYHSSYTRASDFQQNVASLASGMAVGNTAFVDEMTLQLDLENMDETAKEAFKDFFFDVANGRANTVVLTDSHKGVTLNARFWTDFIEFESSECGLYFSTSILMRVI